MKIASMENENGISNLLNSKFDENEVVVKRYENYEDIILEEDLSEFDLILVDMTHNRCIELIQYIKQTTDIPVIYLTNRYKKSPYEQELDDKDFVIHSYSREEFVKFTLKKVEEINNSKIINFGFCSIEVDNGIFRIGNDILNLTKSEINLCIILIKRMGNPVSKELIVKEMAKMGIETTDRSVREHIRKVRKEFKKVKLAPIKTVRGEGYTWVLESCEC
ncbi:response regulator transcription factor [Anaerococcus sp. AGMB00486]|uniref:Response regulator transcription factor n=2 Tax=Anaerococcus TaxID=165779 RepID=A0ABX2N9W2_9FIRM|nr:MULTISPECIES: winged helix-turn-helix domain-containing protein [Anaerococcus]MSS77614.1 response regulator transcription factor [Anaerococcus porci]NVF11468.1 response regulator transcription factor [Anaerococcus faecalis]